jgi:hypothetical protein
MDWQMTNAEWEAWMADKPVLRYLHEKHVFSLGILEGDKIGFLEECDQYFSAALTSADLSALIAELQAVRADLAARETKEAD